MWSCVSQAKQLDLLYLANGNGQCCCNHHRLQGTRCHCHSAGPMSKEQQQRLCSAEEGHPQRKDMSWSDTLMSCLLCNRAAAAVHHAARCYTEHSSSVCRKQCAKRRYNKPALNVMGIAGHKTGRMRTAAWSSIGLLAHRVMVAGAERWRRLTW